MSELNTIYAEDTFDEDYMESHHSDKRYYTEVYRKSEVDKVIADKDFLIKMMRKHIYKLKLADAIEKMNFWVSQKFWWDSLKDKVTTKPLFDYAAKAETWSKRVEKYKGKIKELR